MPDGMSAITAGLYEESRRKDVPMPSPALSLCHQGWEREAASP